MAYHLTETHTAESVIEKKMIKKIRSMHGYVIKNQAKATTGSGRPDLSACINGKYYGIEMKRNTGHVKTTYAQIKNLDLIRQAGGIALWAKSDCLDWLINDKMIEEFIEIKDDILKQINELLNKKEILFIKYESNQYLIVYSVGKFMQ